MAENKTKEEYFEDLKYIANIARIFSEILENDNRALEEIMKIPKKNLQDYVKSISKQARKNGKINKIRYLIAKTIIDHSEITLSEIEEIKKEVNNEHQTNILQSWPNWRILYSIFYYDKKDKVKNTLTELAADLNNRLNLDLKQYIGGFY